MSRENKRKKRHIGLFLSLPINLLIVGYIAVNEFRSDPGAVHRIEVADLRLFYLIFGALCFVIAAFMDYSKYRAMIMVAEGRDDRRGALECSLLGKYYDNITPFGAGGQPFQIHYLKKRGHTAGTASASPVVGFLTQQIAFVLIGIVVFITNRSALEFIPLLQISAYIGLLMYALLPSAVLLFAIFPKPIKALICGFVRLLGKLHIVKDQERLVRRAVSTLDQYLHCIRVFHKRPIFFVKLTFVSLLYQIAILSIPFFMLRAFGGSGNWWTTFSLVVYIYCAITIVPTPGNAGAAEGSFYAVFSSLEGGMLFWAMIAWRVLVYYSWLLCGLFIVIRRSTGRSTEKPLKKPPAEGPMRIAIVCDSFFPVVDGVVRTVDAYAKLMQAQGHEVCVICPKYKDTEYPDIPYPVYTLPALHIPGFAYAVGLGVVSKEVKRLFKTNPPDVIHSHSPFLLGRMALRLGRRYRVPVTATFHSKYYDDAYNVTHSKLLANIMVNYVVDFFAKADIVWACSASTAKTLRGYGYNGEIHVMENGAELHESPYDPATLRRMAVEKYQLPTDRKVLLFVGQMIWQKNLRLILDTMRALKESGGGYYLVLGGSGYHESAIRAYAKELDLEDEVRFIGKVEDRGLLFGLYAYADLFFFPSVYDNAPLVLREAAMAGLPSLLAEGSNAAEIVEDGVNGYTAETTPEVMAEKIRKILNDPRHALVGQRAMETIPISWEEIVSRVLQAYRTCSKEGHKVSFGISGE